MAAVAHVSPADLRRLVVVRTGPAVPVSHRLPAATYRRRRAVALLVVVSGLAALLLVLHGLLASFGGGPLTASERPGAPVAGAAYVVQPGVGVVNYRFKGVPAARTAAGDPAVVPEALRPKDMR